ncbi:MAG: TIGR04086 family membrane protein [Firmicutes bacterium]|nr:TIGR04086 family membrane protein [Bacillota bacterium]
MGINFKGVIKGTLFSLIITFAIILILSLLSYFTQISENVITTGAYVSVAAGILLGTTAVARAAAQKVFLHAMLVCVLYLIAFTAISAAVNKGISFNSHFLAVTVGALAAGFLGAVIGG